MTTDVVDRIWALLGTAVHHLLEKGAAEGHIPEDPSIVFKLRDNGVEPDVMADDDIWTLTVDVPFNAPTGQFTLEITAYNKDDEPILVQNSYREVEPMKTTVSLTIEANE